MLLLMFNAAVGGRYQIASITAPLLPLPAILFVLVIGQSLGAAVIGRIGV